MAYRCGALTRSAVARARSAIHSKGSSFSAEGRAASSRFSAHIANGNAAPQRRFLSASRLPTELACAQSLIPLHSAVAAARLTSCLSVNSSSCRMMSQDSLSPAGEHWAEPKSPYAYPRIGSGFEPNSQSLLELGLSVPR